MRGLARARAGVPVAMLTLGAMAIGSACSTEEPAPRFLDDSGVTDAGADVRADRYIPCDPTDSRCADAASDASDDSGDAGLCPATNGCSTARDLGKVSGDTNADQQNAMGSSSEWLKVRVTEDDSSVIGRSMKARISLVSPPGANFDLFVYYDPLVDVVKCTPRTASSTQQAGISDVVSLVWGEIGSTGNASDDSRTVTLEVRHVSGVCNKADTWTLLVQGNQQ